MRDGAQWFVENTDIKLVGNDDPLQGEIAWNRTPRELGLSAYALQQLGGSHAATPNQIRELMKVDGLTNDEVKSHLQVSLVNPKIFSPQLSLVCSHCTSSSSLPSRRKGCGVDHLLNFPKTRRCFLPSINLHRHGFIFSVLL
ncbi:hypothetical protein ACFX2J_018868 [Malus domestica]